MPDGGKVEGRRDLQILTVITTNGEREMPQAFLRRCIILDLAEPDEDQLIGIAGQHFPDGDSDRIQAIANKIVGFRPKAEELRRRAPGTGEFLDAIRACEDIGIDVDDDPDSVWHKIENAVLLKVAES